MPNIPEYKEKSKRELTEVNPKGLHVFGLTRARPKELEKGTACIFPRGQHLYIRWRTHSGAYYEERIITSSCMTKPIGCTKKAFHKR